MSDQDNDDVRGKPSQAEGEDPGRTREADATPAEGHPSQAEGEDPGRPAADSEGPDGRTEGE